MQGRLWFVVGILIAVAAIMVACGSDDNSDPVVGQAPLTVENSASPTSVVAAAPTQTPDGLTLTPSPTALRLVTSTPTPPPPMPTNTAVPTETPGWREYTVQGGDSCFDIAARFGHVDPGSVSAIESLNNIRCSQLQPNSTILVPLPTPTATEIGMDLTQTAVATSAPPQMSVEDAGVFAVQEYAVVSGDTIQGVAFKNGTTMQQVCELNPLPDGLNCSGCWWEGGQFICPTPPVLVVGQRLNVPAPTPTPTASPTFTGSETPTLTPTYRAPEPISPHNDAEVGGAVRLSWLTVGALNPGEQYFVRVRDETTGAAYETTTRQLSLDVPLDYLPNDGQVHAFTWEVVVVHAIADGYLQPISQAVGAQHFTWLGWGG